MSEIAKNLDKQKKNDHAWRAIHGLVYWEKKWTCILNILISIIEGLIQEKWKLCIKYTCTVCMSFAFDSVQKKKIIRWSYL